MADKRESQRRSPLKHKPLRQAGQSAEERRMDIIFDALGIYMGAGVAFIYALLEWCRYWRNDQFHPWVWTGVALIAALWAARKIRAALKEARQYREGRDGERIVAERLEELRSEGFHPLHDIAGGDFNIDHVLVGPSGVFAIETKTLHKRGGAEEKAEFNGREILVQGAPLPRNPVTQAQANANWLRDFLRESTGRSLTVTPVVILPGWYVKPPHNMREVLVLNDHPNGLHAYLVKQPERLSPTDISLIKSHLSLFVRKLD
jgi:hypothetical protein